MTITEFDIRAAKLQAKLLQELGEAVPADVRALAEYVIPEPEPVTGHRQQAAPGTVAGEERPYVLLHVPGRPDLVAHIRLTDVHMKHSEMVVSFPDEEEADRMYKEWFHLMRENGFDVD